MEWSSELQSQKMRRRLSAAFHIMWGRYELVLKPTPGACIVSSIVLQSDDRDEIDWVCWFPGYHLLVYMVYSWVSNRNSRSGFAARPVEAQSNYFGKGNTGIYDHGGVHPVDSQARFHKYAIDWTAKRIDWLIDDVVVLTLMDNHCQNRIMGWWRPR